MEFYFQQFWIHQTWNIYTHVLREKNEEEKEKRKQGEGEGEEEKEEAREPGGLSRWNLQGSRRAGDRETDAARGVPRPAPGGAPSEELSVSFKAFCCLDEARPHEGECSALLRATGANGNLLSKYFTAASKARLSKRGYRAGRVDTASERRWCGPGKPALWLAGLEAALPWGRTGRRACGRSWEHWDRLAPAPSPLPAADSVLADIWGTLGPARHLHPPLGARGSGPRGGPGPEWAPGHQGRGPEGGLLAQQKQALNVLGLRLQFPPRDPLTSQPELSFLSKKRGGQPQQRRACLRPCPQEGSPFFSSTWWGMSILYCGTPGLLSRRCFSHL